MNPESTPQEPEVNINVPENKVNGPSVMYVDDDAFLREVYKAKFTKGGFNIECISSSEEVLKKLRDGASPDIILLDIIMPSINGIQLLETIRKDGLASKSMIMLLTNQTIDGDSEKAKALGAAGFITKSVNVPSEVVDIVIDTYKKFKG